MNATEIALAASLIINVLLAAKWVNSTYDAALARRDADYWRDSAHHWTRLFDDLRRNSVARNPRTGRYMKKGY